MRRYLAVGALSQFCLLVPQFVWMGRPGRRARVHRLQDSRFQDLCRTLHEMDGQPDGVAVDCSLAPFGKDARARLARRVVEFGSPQLAFWAADGPPPGREALRQLPGSHADDEGESAVVVRPSWGWGR